jgi:hypothetical protein
VLDYDVMRERCPNPRDLYLELQIIEERGRRLKQARRSRIAAFLSFGIKRAWYRMAASV